MLSDDELVEQILLGNENAAEELIKRYYTSILRYCRWHCSNLEKAEDLTQETFLKLFKNLSGYKGKKKFKAYLYTIANHLCIDESRKVEFYPLEDEENIVHEYNDIVRLEDRAEISYFLNFLSSEQREAVILRFGEQLSFGEIAEYLPYKMQKALDLIPLVGSSTDIFRTNTFRILGKLIWSPYLLITIPVLIGILCMPFAIKSWSKRMKA